jgi:hypothetical protein
MDEYLALLLDSDLSKWEGRSLVLALTVAGGILQYAVINLIKRMDAAAKSRHADHVRLGQIEEVVVKKLCNGHPFPNLVENSKGD